jgi:hypothetical protein
MSNVVGMSAIAAGSVHLALGIANAIDAVGDAIYDHRYNTALEASAAHAYQMEAVARTAVDIIAELEAENIRLRAACQQRSDCIRAMQQS